MRTLVIGDIHGCLNSLDTLLASVSLESEDLLITLGDYVDRGPNVRGVIDRLLELDKQLTLIPLRGNHELMMLDVRDLGATTFWELCGGRQTLESYSKEDAPPSLDNVPQPHWEFLENRCVDWHQDPENIYVHATVHPDLPLEKQGEDDLFWNKLGQSRPHSSGKTVICGHTAQLNGQPLDRGHLVCIDTCAFGPGWLTCLNPMTREFWQANEAGESRSGKLGEEM